MNSTEAIYEAALRKLAMTEYTKCPNARRIAAAALHDAKTTKETNR